MLRCAGRVTRFTAEPWEMNGSTGVSKKAVVLVGEADVVTCTITPGSGIPDPRYGDQVDWAVDAQVAFNKLKVAVVGDWETFYKQQESESNEPAY